MSRCTPSGLAGSRSAAEPAAQALPPAASERPGDAGRDAAASGRPWLKAAALYARVSSDKQEKEQTIASQLETLHRAAAERGFQVPPDLVFADDGYSGARLDRPALDRLRDLAAEGGLAAVLIAAPDRLARHYAYQVLLLEELARAGCETIFLNHAFDGSPEHRMLLQMQGVFAEYERALIQERMRRGRLFATRQGRASWGKAPYGYRYLRKTDTTPPRLVVDEAESQLVQQMYRWLVEERLTSYAIQRRLNEQGIAPRGGPGRAWSQSTVIDILRNPIYTGQAMRNRHQRCDARRPRGQAGYKDRRPGNGRGRTLRPREEWIAVAVPMIIEPELWQLAQEQRARNRAEARRNNTKHEYLLRGLLICGQCGQCGRRMVGEWSGAGDNRGRYVCSARQHDAGRRCTGRSVAAARVEAEVWEYVRGLLADPALLRARYEDCRGDPAVHPAEEREAERLERTLRTLEREVQRLIDAYQAGVIELPELSDRRHQVEDRGRMLRTRLDEIGRQRQEREQEIRLLQDLDDFCASIQESLVDPSFDIKRKVLQLVVDRIIVEDARLIVRHIVPAGPVRLQTEHQAA
ncbi:recombinase family protein [Azospirillum sp. sgz302134]